MASSVKENSKRLSTNWSSYSHLTSSGFFEPEASIAEGITTKPSTYPKRCWVYNSGSI
jgi:hypothetical protein